MVHIKAVVVVSLFFLLNVGLSLLNRWALGVKGFSFPIFLTMFQALFLFTSIVCSSVFIPKVRGMTGTSRRTMVKEWKGVVWVGIWTSLNVVLNNFSLVYISLSLNQVLRSSIPLVTAVVSSIHGRKMPTKAEVFGLFVLCGGVIIAIGEASANGNAFGVMLCLASVVAGAYMLTTTAHTLHEKMSSFQLAFMTAPVTVSCLAPPFFVFESGVVAEYVVLNPHMTAMILLSGSILASAYNVVHNELVGIVGPVTTTVLGQVKIVSLMLLSGILFGEGKDFSLKMSIGCSSAILGFSIYSWAKINQQLDAAATQKAAAAGEKLFRTPSGVRGKRPPRLNVADSPDATLPGVASPMVTPIQDTPSRSTSMRTRSTRKSKKSAFV
mmetsp:Transcript_7915/g.15903  ORF Transcript_7915/g.15903 Transcript_7915/m.15903 type:complete len:382 (+) Transcript_7915:190-1335(+)